MCAALAALHSGHLDGIFLAASGECENVGINDKGLDDVDELVALESFDLIPNSPAVLFARLP
jgi:hypothetical protein